MIIDGLTFYTRSPLFDQALPAGKRWLKIDLDAIGKQAGFDVGALMTQGAGQDPTQVLAYLKAASGDVSRVGSEAVRGVPTTHYKATIDFRKMPDSAPADQRAAVRRSIEQLIELSGASTAPIEVWIDEDGLARRLLTTTTTGTAAQRVEAAPAHRPLRLRDEGRRDDPAGERGGRRRRPRRALAGRRLIAPRPRRSDTALLRWRQAPDRTHRGLPHACNGDARAMSTTPSPLRALALNGTLKPPPDPSNTEALTEVVLDALRERSVECEIVRLADLTIAPGVVSEAVRPGDQWPEVHAKVVAADIVIFATPTWFGQPSSEIKRAFERLNAMLSETDDEGVPLAYNEVRASSSPASRTARTTASRRWRAPRTTSASPFPASPGRTGTRARGSARRST